MKEILKIINKEIEFHENQYKENAPNLHHCGFIGGLRQARIFIEGCIDTTKANGVVSEFKKLQEKVNEWSLRNFGEGLPHRALLGATEEIGELCHAHLKNEQGIRTNEDHRADAEDAIGDTIIYLADYCSRNGYDLDKCIAETWEKVSKRDWTQNKVDGTA